jgi:hypothetical protein
MLQLLQRLPQFRNLLQQFKKSEVSTDNNFRDFNVMDQATGEVKKLEVKPYEQTVAQKWWWRTRPAPIKGETYPS